MGTKGNEILGIDAEEVITLLNKALADEWLAYYQYWIGAKVVVGPMKNALIPELIEHAADELRHAEMLVERILQLGGTPLLSPEDWYTHTNCGYEKPDNPAVKKVLEQNIKGEQCAIEVYNKIVNLVKDKDLVTYNMAVSILQDEIEHEDDLQALEEDMG